MENLINIRKQNKRTQQQVATFLGLTQQAYAAYENDIAQPPKDVIIKLADYFNVTVDYLLGRTEKLVIPENLNDVQIAFYDGVKDLTQEEIDEVSKFVDYIKSRKK